MALRIAIPMPPRLTHYVLCAALESSYGASWLSEYVGNRSQWTRDGREYVALHIGAPIDDATTPQHSRIGASRIAAALSAMLTHPKHAERAARVIAGTGDAPDADVVLQFAAFGEVIYG